MSLLISLVVSSVGVVFMIAGKRLYSTVYLVCGALLLIASYVIDNPIALVLTGLIVSAVPYALKRGWV
jgi:hypothetical protein